MKLAERLGASEAEMLERATDTIVSQVEALRTLVDAFGEYANEPELDLAPLQLDELIQDVVSLYQQGHSDLRFELNLCSGPAGLSADAGRIRQLLHNLIRNASEAFAPKEHASITISTRVIKGPAGEDLVELSVADRGPGFPASVLQNPFEPYVTNKPNGSGLGLAICRKIAEEHDGQVTIANQVEGGAIAAVTLPLNRS